MGEAQEKRARASSGLRGLSGGWGRLREGEEAQGGGMGPGERTKKGQETLWRGQVKPQGRMGHAYRGQESRPRGGWGGFRGPT